jgi:hypothetical protein
MSEHVLPVFISAAVTVLIALVTTLLLSLRNWKKEFKAANDKEHAELWERVNHHSHNGGGRVVIPTPGIGTKL